MHIPGLKMNSYDNLFHVMLYLVMSSELNKTEVTYFYTCMRHDTVRVKNLPYEHSRWLGTVNLHVHADLTVSVT